MKKRALLSEAAVAELLNELSGWELQEGSKLYKEFRFPNFVQAVGWMMQIAIEAEKLDHHPNWSNVYNKVSVTLWTHSEGGLTKLDAKLALAMDKAKGE